jgi:prophage DNA circulation protein
LAHLIQQLAAYCAEIEISLQQNTSSNYDASKSNKIANNSIQVPTISHDMINTFLRNYADNKQSEDSSSESDIMDNSYSSLTHQKQQYGTQQEMSSTWNKLLHTPDNSESQLTEYIFNFILEVTNSNTSIQHMKDMVKLMNNEEKWQQQEAPIKQHTTIVVNTSRIPVNTLTATNKDQSTDSGLLESELQSLLEEISLTEQSFQKQEIYRKESKQVRTVIDSVGPHNVTFEQTMPSEISIYNEISPQESHPPLDLSEV